VRELGDPMGSVSDGRSHSDKDDCNHKVPFFGSLEVPVRCSSYRCWLDANLEHGAHWQNAGQAHGQAHGQGQGK